MSVARLACLGGEPCFASPVPVGQLYFPSWERYETAFRDIFDRQYYTNQGPLTEKFEAELAAFLQVRHVVCVTNATIGLMMVAEALELKGKVILPSFTFAASAQAMAWTQLEPVFCDVLPRTGQIGLSTIESAWTDDVSAIMGVNLWGGSCGPQALEQLAARRGVKLFFDSAHAFGCSVDGKLIGGYGSAEVFSFHATKILSCAEGGGIATNDEAVAARLRNIRSSYGARHPVKVGKTSNGRMSEAQAAIGLMSLADFSVNRDNNERLHALYQKGMAGVPGVEVVMPEGMDRSNFQYAVFRIDATAFGMPRDYLIDTLQAENVIARRYFHPGLHKSLPWKESHPEFLQKLPVTDVLCTQFMQLPLGAQTTDSVIATICDLVRAIQRQAASIRPSQER